MGKSKWLMGAIALAAGAVSGSAGAQPGPCPHLHTQSECLAYPTGECFWDTTDWRCESRYASDAKCGTIYNKWTCVWTPGCFWDETDYRCERKF
ncbi:MAG: hypothetical protein R3B70_48760 [Polyangiaceae bacterium]